MQQGSRGETQAKGGRLRLLDDVLAGASGAIAGAPQAMGFAIIAGVNPIYGLYTAFITTIVATLTSSATYMTVAPTNALALVVFSTLSDVDDIRALFTLTLLVGVFQLLLSVLRLGSLTRFVSNAVMTGFITGAALLIILNQLGNLTGYTVDAREPLSRLWDWLTHLGAFDPRATLIGLLSIVIIVGLGRTRLRGISTLAAIIVTAVLVHQLNWEGVALVRDISAVPSGFPMPTMPDFAAAQDLALAALAMAVLGSVQSAGISNAVPEPDGSTSHATRDFFGQGLGNIVGGFFQCMPASGSLSRTAVNIRAGARSKLANVMSGVFIGAAILLLGDYIEQIVLAALAGQLIVAAMSLINPAQLRLVWRVDSTARASMAATFVSTLILPLQYSIYIGVILSLVLYVLKSADRIRVVRLVRMEDGRFREVPLGDSLPDNDVVIFSVSGNLYFAAVRKLEELLPSPRSQGTVVILRLRDNLYLGSTGIRFLRRYASELRARGGDLLLAGVGEEVRQQLERTQALYAFGIDHIFFAGDIYFESTARALDYARALVDEPTA